MNYRISLGNFVEQFCKFSSVRVESAYNGKCLSKNYKPGRNEELDKRIVTSVTPYMVVPEDRAFTFSYLRICVEGDVELEKEEKLKKIFASEYTTSQAYKDLELEGSR